MELKNSVKYIYDRSNIGWGPYDDMFPTEIDSIHKEVKLGTNESIESYFKSFIKFLIQIGFDEDEVKEQGLKLFLSMYNDESEVSTQAPKELLL
jgi:hypothetical protein|tara:strand:- start:105 stop:386 length:282 start_codon:yes stop_codon:yes gene_type:complete